MERVVNRSELHSNSSDFSESSEHSAIERLKQLDDFDTVKNGNADLETVNPSGNALQIDEDESEYDFRLFRPAKTVASEQTAEHVHKIKLLSPPLSKENAGFIKSQKDPTYYFAAAPSHLEKENFESTALTGADVLANSQSPWPGSSYPWKVLHLPITNVAKSIRPQSLQPFRHLINSDRSSKRARPGKKYRIKIRQRQAAILAQQENTKAAAAEKEAAEREKRTRKNREKKVKKRLRDKKKKEATATTADPDASNVDESVSPQPSPV